MRLHWTSFAAVSLLALSVCHVGSARAAEVSPAAPVLAPPTSAAPDRALAIDGAAAEGADAAAAAAPAPVETVAPEGLPIRLGKSLAFAVVVCLLLVAGSLWQRGARGRRRRRRR